MDSGTSIWIKEGTGRPLIASNANFAWARPAVHSSGPWHRIGRARREPAIECRPEGAGLIERSMERQVDRVIGCLHEVREVVPAHDAESTSASDDRREDDEEEEEPRAHLEES